MRRCALPSKCMDALDGLPERVALVVMVGGATGVSAETAGLRAARGVMPPVDEMS